MYFIVLYIFSMVQCTGRLTKFENTVYCVYDIPPEREETV